MQDFDIPLCNSSCLLNRPLARSTRVLRITKLTVYSFAGSYSKIKFLHWDSRSDSSLQQLTALLWRNRCHSCLWGISFSFLPLKWHWLPTVSGISSILRTKLLVLTWLLRLVEDQIILGHIGQGRDTSLRLIVASVNFAEMHCSLCGLRLKWHTDSVGWTFSKNVSSLAIPV